VQPLEPHCQAPDRILEHERTPVVTQAGRRGWKLTQDISIERIFGSGESPETEPFRELPTSLQPTAAADNVAELGRLAHLLADGASNIAMALHGGGTAAHAGTNLEGSTRQRACTGRLIRDTLPVDMYNAVGRPVSTLDVYACDA